MTGMDIFNVVVGLSTIISLGLSIFATTQVISIKNSMVIHNRDFHSANTGSQNIAGNNNRQAGGDIGK